MTGSLRSHRARLALGLLAGYAATLALWLSYARYGFNPWDECVLAYGGLRVLAGQMVWVDFFGYAPGRYLLAALSYRLLGTDLMSLRVAFAVWTAVTPPLAYLVARRLVPHRWALVPAVLVALGPSTYYFRPFPFVALLGAWSLCRLIEAPSVGRQVQHGLALFVCAMLESAAGGFVVLLTPLALWISAGPWIATRGDLLRGLARSLGTAAAAALPLLLYYAWTGKLGEGVALQAYRYVVTGASMWVAYPDPWSSLLAGYWQQAVQDSFFWAMALALGGAVALACAGFAFSRRHWASLGSSHAAEAQHAMLCLLAMLNFLLPLYRAGFFNVLRIAPLCWILGTHAVAVLAAAGRPGRPWWRRAALPAVALLYPLALGLHLVSARDYRNPSTGGPPGAALSEGLVRLGDPRAGGIEVEPRHAELLREVLGWIRRDTREDDPILAVPLNPLFYWFGRRGNPTAHDYILPGYWRDRQQIEQTLRSLEARPPKLVIYGDVPVDGFAARRFHAYSGDLFEYFVRRYAWTDRHAYPLGPRNLVPFLNYRRLRKALHWPSSRLQAASRAQSRGERGRADATGSDAALETPGRGAAVSGGGKGAPRVHGAARTDALLELDGVRVHGWRLRPGSAVEVDVSTIGRHVFVFRAHAPGAGAAWTRPELRLSVISLASRPGAAATEPPAHEPGAIAPDALPADAAARERAAPSARVLRTLLLDADPELDGRLWPMAAVRLAPGPGERLVLRLQVVARRPEQLGGEWQLAQPALLAEDAVFFRAGEPIPPPTPDE